MSTAGLSMSVGSGGGLHHEIQEAIAQMELLKVLELKAVCRSIELPITGRKSILQDRIRAYLKNSCSIGRIDPWRPKTIKILIEKSKAGQVLPKYEMVWQTIRSGAFNHPVATGQLPVSSLQEDGTLTVGNQVDYNATNTVRPSDVYVGPTRPSMSVEPRKTYIHFKESPFYKMRKLIPETAQKINVTNVRGVCSCKFKFTKAEWNLLQGNKKFKVYLFCAAASPSAEAGNVPIQFPHPNEIRFNDTQVKDNVRGLKNKVGTAKPADLTPYLRPPPAQNVLEIVYAFTKNEFFTYCYIVEEVLPEELLQEVLKHPKIIKHATLQYIKQTLREEEDDDLVTTSTVMSLQCPVSFTRMKYPAKSIMCKHLQCFDALWYIYSQMQIPTWQCPVCQIEINLKDLAVCEYVDEILKNSEEDVEQVELSSDGSWTPVVEETTAKPNDRQQSNTMVKTENDYDDYDNVPLSKQNAKEIGASASNQPVVISLDSDLEDEDDIEQNDTPNSDKTQENNRSAAVRLSSDADHPGLYMDSSSTPSEATLDPRAHTAETPTAMRTESDRTESNTSYFNREIPNSLDKTPLNNSISDNDTSLPDASTSSPAPSTIIRGLFTPAYQPASSVGHPYNGVNDSHGSPTIRSNGTSSTMTTVGTPDLNKREHSRRTSQVVSNSLLGLTGNSVVAPSLPVMNCALQDAEGTANNGEGNGIIPQLPPLPVTQAIEIAAHGARKNINGRSNLATHGSNLHARTKKPVVSPFIPKKPYLNMLPQKRNISNASSRSILSPESPASIHNNQGADNNNTTSQPIESSSEPRDSSVIDLTSD